jgi:hypothetical protein
MYQTPFNLRFKIGAKVFSFISNFINKSCRVWNLVSNKTNFAIFGFFYNLYRIKHISALGNKTSYSYLQKTP